MNKILQKLSSIHKIYEILASLQRENIRLKLENERLTKLSLLDPLTGIANRRYLERNLQQEYKNSLRHSHNLGLLMIDLDRFKLYNDHFGHQAGDQLLIEITLTFEEVLRRPKDMLFRYGGEELICLLPNTSVEGVTQVGQKLLTTARKCGVTVSIGAICANASKLESPQQLLEIADQAMYQAKNQGRDRLIFRQVTNNVYEVNAEICISN
ncbi:MAG: GGDEF domain-containing protein [Cyanobacteria bacterium P01_A01_bin.40]